MLKHTQKRPFTYVFVVGGPISMIMMVEEEEEKRNWNMQCSDVIKRI